jgi:hypothetical protein
MASKWLLRKSAPTIDTIASAEFVDTENIGLAGVHCHLHRS